MQVVELVVVVAMLELDPVVALNAFILVVQILPLELMEMVIPRVQIVS
jgi:hypothetical protein